MVDRCELKAHCRSLTQIKVDLRVGGVAAVCVNGAAEVPSTRCVTPLAEADWRRGLTLWGRHQRSRKPSVDGGGLQSEDGHLRRISTPILAPMVSNASDTAVPLGISGSRQGENTPT